MKKNIKLVLFSLAALILTTSASYADNHSVYCEAYRDGYSLFRTIDNKDIGNAYFIDYGECMLAADLANQVGQNLACSPFVDQDMEIYGYSAYRISDGADLAQGVFEYFNDCQSAVSHAHHGIVCLIFSVDSSPHYAPYDIESGDTVGDMIYNDIESCQASY